MTIIATNAPIIIFGDLITKNVMLITNQTISFAGGSLSKDPQQVEGIFVATSYDGTTKLMNTDSSQRWIDDGRLVIRGILI